ncbi:hypothetical protein QTP70_001669 [Hemibagrus guttatus]|uniref:Uncharacterized protein n=1 Tax=Hemibagrus guttatus TaxID=175788 RepID=A0AAE0R6X1_9TELE|nr:hypothetical protein QTP70_001669 [Hemibagrus guttatus]
MVPAAILNGPLLMLATSHLASERVLTVHGAEINTVLSALWWKLCSKSSGESSGGTVGLAVGLGFLFIVLLILMITLWSCKRKKAKASVADDTVYSMLKHNMEDCFECTDWNMFREAATNGDSINLEEYTTSVTSYIGKCIDDVTVSKTITTRSNQKPWMTAEVRALLKRDN